MRFFVTTTLPSFSSGAKQPHYIHFSDAGHDVSLTLAGLQGLDVWICNGDEVTSDLVDQWLSQTPETPKSMLVRDANAIPRLQEYSKGRVAEISTFPEEQPGASVRERDEAILREAEMLYAQARANAGSRRANVDRLKSNGAQTVVLVGAGIMNLMTAQLLVERGYKVRIVEQAPDPRACQPKDWTSLGVTSGGHNARMFTHTEADNYNEQNSDIYQDMQSIFRKTVQGGGWSVKDPKDFSSAEQAWVGAFERVPGWMAAMFKKNIHSVNCESWKLWKELMNTAPELFQDVGLHNDIVRLYVETLALDASVTLNRRLGSLLQAPSTPDLLKSFPGFRSAAESDHLAGGIIAEGFTVNIHLFVAKLINHLIARGAEFIWDCKVQGVQRNPDGEVTFLQSQKGSLEADHFVVSPGTTGAALLHGTASENLIQGVLGIWLQLPNLDPQIHNSMKIHRRAHKVEDINITVAKDQQTGEDILILGGGYGYVGLDRPAPDSQELNALYDELEEVARIYFPQGYAEAKKRGPTAMYPGGHRKFCVRPFTPTGLGVFEQIPTARGGQLIITGGNNTGGFAQAPGIARAVLRSFQGEHDPIHTLFHPDRGKIPPSTTTTTTTTTTNYKSRSPSPVSSSIDLKASSQPPLRLLLICSDSPNHRYLRYRLDQAFPGYHCISEPNAGQLRHLAAQGRTVDAWWQRYHGARRQLFGYARQRAAHFDRLVPEGYVSPPPDLVVDTINSKEVWEAVEGWRPELTVVSGTKYIGKKLIARAGLMVNLHTGHLPEYKGNHCVFFALRDGRVDRVASTLHQLTASLDGGDVLDRVYPVVEAGDSEDTLYTKCLEAAIDRVVEHVGRFARGERLEFVPQVGDGTTFRHRDRTPGKEAALWWKVNVGGLLKKTAKEKIA
ncbi:FAD dependent oxidoreductase-domain-containing protein [Chaetomium tenue]|uniref:FAD dependent oxidoreductase-domain-containing protein n=1 Tax=Chaetomium tenue TaxID=1854479 RepID=A0ACB7PJ73_9PEZI|nr:FAD dependent oxidoreductase-domain-containing protein [Chaetomium globosum]